MNTKYQDKVTYIMIVLIIIVTGCINDNNKQKLSLKDTTDILSLAFNSQGKLKESLSEDWMQRDSAIYIVVDSLPAKRHWPERIIGFQVILTDSFNFRRNFIEQAHDKRFTISCPEFTFTGDTVDLNFQSHYTFMRHDFKFVKQEGKWIEVYNNSIIETIRD